MITKEFKIEISANAEKVWFALWDEYNYRIWTSVFQEGSYAVSDWKEGSKIHFLIPSGSGMYSFIDTNKSNEKMVFRHIGNILNFEEQDLDEDTMRWTGATESYTVHEKDGKTVLVASFTSIEEHINFFNDYIPKALDKIKSAAENLEIKVETLIHAGVAEVWKKWTSPADILKWNTASEDWHTTKAESDLKPGGKVLYRMEAKDGSFGFDFSGVYKEIIPNELIRSLLDDGRSLKVLFNTENGQTKVTEFFNAENTNSPELQKFGWQSILNNFKKYVESKK
jgi:uncharacterized protein YndB with AHSA1/START domain